jgi:hypothetical protein
MYQKNSESVKMKGGMFILNNHSRMKLLMEIGEYIPEGWDVIAHHMTICLGCTPPKRVVNDLGKTKLVRITHIGKSDKALAVAVEGYYSEKSPAHITIAVNRKEGGKPRDADGITEWVKIKSRIQVSGTISEFIYQ